MRGAGRLTSMLRAAVVLLSLAVTATAGADVLKKGDRLKELDVAVDANGKSFKLKPLNKDKWLLVTAGAAWCGPCKKELPAWDKLAAELKGKITFVALGLDNEVADGKKFHDKLKIKNMVRVYLPEEKSAVAATYGAETMPSTFVIDPQGVVRMVKAGFNERDADDEIKKMRAELGKLLTP
jgi:thiol-disulfide isomerase/thioredoxin